jgi:hypothetical protein
MPWPPTDERPKRGYICVVFTSTCPRKSLNISSDTPLKMHALVVPHARGAASGLVVTSGGLANRTHDANSCVANSTW